MNPSRMTRTGLVLGAIAAIAACSDAVSSPSAVRIPTGAALAFISPPTIGDRAPDIEFVEVCKDYVMTSGATPPTASFTANGNVFTLDDGECRDVWIIGGTGEDVTVTETSPASGFTTTYKVTPYTGSVTGPTSGTSTTVHPSGTNGYLIEFVNTEIVEGCTYTQGYWKTHSTYGPAGPADDGWANVGGPDADFFSSGLSWYELFWTPVAGRKYVSLAHQYMAAKLNVLNGADPSAISAALSAAEAWFPGKSLTAVPPTNTWQSAFAAFNEGSTGPGHCADETTS